MSVLVGWVPSPSPIADPRLKSKIQFLATASIPLEVITAMSLVTKAVADQLQREDRLIGNQPIVCIFSSDDKFTIQLDPNQIAVCMRIAVYPLGKLSAHFGSDKLYTILAEELCHLIWDISDETEVNFKVLSVLRNLNPNLQMTDLYSEETARSCDRWLQDHPAFRL